MYLYEWIHKLNVLNFGKLPSRFVRVPACLDGYMYINLMFTFLSWFCRSACLFGWLYEHCSGTDGGVCEWTIEKQIRGCLHKGEQWWVHCILKRCVNCE